VVALAEITAGFEALKAAAGLVQALSASATQATINEVKLELQQRLLDAQTALFAAQQIQTAATERVSDLEQEIVRLKDWKGEKQRYKLHPIDVGSVAYVPKPGMENGEPPYWLCASCFEEGHRSILQYQRNVTGGGGAKSIYKCGRCQNELAVFWHYSPAQPYVPPQGAQPPPNDDPPPLQVIRED
jgi:hypothetical protein